MILHVMCGSPYWYNLIVIEIIIIINNTKLSVCIQMLRNDYDNKLNCAIVLIQFSKINAFS